MPGKCFGIFCSRLHPTKVASDSDTWRAWLRPTTDDQRRQPGQADSYRPLVPCPTSGGLPAARLLFVAGPPIPCPSAEHHRQQPPRRPTVEQRGPRTEPLTQFPRPQTPHADTPRSALFVEPKWAQFLQSSGVTEALGAPSPAASDEHQV